MRVTPLLLAATVLAAAAPAQARTGSVTCRVGATQLVFGTYYGRTAIPQDMTATITVTCTALTPMASEVSFTVMPGDGETTNRNMHRSAQALRYELFVDSARSIPWGTGTAGSPPLKGSGTVSRTAPLRASFTLYGRVLARQRLAAGPYTDTVPIRLEW